MAGSGPTEELAASDAYLSEAEGSVVSVASDGLFLDRTVFYARGGGQPGDVGVIRWDGGEVEVLDTVRRSILSPGVRVNSTAEVTDCVLFDDVDVGRGAVVRRAVIDKNVRVPPGEEIGVDVEKDRARFTISERGVVFVAKDTVFG